MFISTPNPEQGTLYSLAWPRGLQVPQSTEMAIMVLEEVLPLLLGGFDYRSSTWKTRESSVHSPIGVSYKSQIAILFAYICIVLYEYLMFMTSFDSWHNPMR